MTNHILSNVQQLIDPGRKIDESKLKNIDFRQIDHMVLFTMFVVNT